MDCMEKIMTTVDRLFDENRPKEAERYMLEQLQLAREKGEEEEELLLYNELIGYYRQTSEKKELQTMIEGALKVSEQMGIRETIPYATTLLNIANAYRSMGETALSREYYTQVEAIYHEKLTLGENPENDLLIAGLYNNISLLYQEEEDYNTALKYQERALEIVTNNEASFEIAVSYANLANTCLLAKKYEQAKQYAEHAMALFEERGLRDPHYASAMSALGYCLLSEGEKQKAREVFLEALHIVEHTFGKNAQYMRLMDSIKLCGEIPDMNGLELCKAYYEQYGRKMLEEKFPDYIEKIAVGLVGEGSDCYGFDDELSRDHDYGPDFCMWLTDETYEEIGEALAKEYAKLPDTFMGVTRMATAMGQGRRGVMRISDFYRRYIGTANPEEVDYALIPDYALAACTNGAVFCDEEGIFTGIRKQLKAGYPPRLRLLKLAEDVANISQSGQYNFDRMLRRGDEITAKIMLADWGRQVMKWYHHFYNQYPPHDKWLVKSVLRLPEGDVIVRAIEGAMSIESAQMAEDIIEQTAAVLAQKMYESGEISDTDSYLEHHFQELLFKSGIVELKKEELVDRIARLEFKAFDQVENEGGRASCQNNWPVFSIMRKSQYLTWSHEMLVQYLYDFTREYEKGHNLITEKYGRMMESTAPQRYEEIKDFFPPISEEKKAVIEQIVHLQMEMADAFAEQYPKTAGNARDLHSYEDNYWNTSYETYLRGEISTYSDKMLQLYGGFVVRCAKEGVNITYITMENTAKMYGYNTIEELENK